MASDEYTLSDIQNAPPVEYKVVDGILYCSGVRTEMWQLTDQEKERFFPLRVKNAKS